MSMKYLMATRADETVKGYAEYTIPILKKYAREWGADFKILDESFGSHIWRILALYDLLKSYDRILHIDSDVVMNKNCPNIFNKVSLDSVGLIFEDRGSRKGNRRREMAKIKQRFGNNEHWICGYFNIGVFLVSQAHRDMFTKINGQLWDGVFLEQTHLNYQMMRLGYKYIDLGYKWNHMSMFSESWYGSPSRFDSYIIHYAGGARGGGFPGKGKRNRTQLIKDDIKKIYGEKKCP